MNNTNPLKISVVVTTYNWPEALNLVLRGLVQQVYPHFEIIVADDGSTQETASLIEQYQQHTSIPVQHVWHPDEGFRAAGIRNRAIEHTIGDYIVFLDGDCIPRPNFLTHHVKLAESNRFISGNRILLSKDYTEEVIEKEEQIGQFTFLQWVGLRLTGKINRLLPLLNWPDGAWRHQNNRRWEGAITCNLSAWKSNLLAVNGFDESFQGWGLEDSDLVIRLINSGIRRKEGRFATGVLHLWHPHADRESTTENRSRLEQAIKNQTTTIQNGIIKN